MWCELVNLTITVVIGSIANFIAGRAGHAFSGHAINAGQHLNLAGAHTAGVQSIKVFIKRPITIIIELIATFLIRLTRFAHRRRTTGAGIDPTTALTRATAYAAKAFIRGTIAILISAITGLFAGFSGSPAVAPCKSIANLDALGAPADVTATTAYFAGLGKCAV